MEIPMKIRLIRPAEYALIIDTTLGIIRFRGGGRGYDGQMLKADPDARIITDAPERVCLALGLAYPDPQVIGN